MTIVLIIWIVLLVISIIIGTIVGIYQCKDSTQKDSTIASNTKDKLDDNMNVDLGKYEIDDLSNSDTRYKPIAASDDRTNKAETSKTGNKTCNSDEAIKALVKRGVIKAKVSKKRDIA